MDRQVLKDVCYGTGDALLHTVTGDAQTRFLLQHLRCMLCAPAMDTDTDTDAATDKAIERRLLLRMQMLYWVHSRSQTLGSYFQTMTLNGKGRPPMSLSKKR